MFPNKKDYLTRNTGLQIAENNCLWEIKCLSEKERNPNCPKVDEIEDIK